MEYRLIEPPRGLLPPGPTDADAGFAAGGVGGSAGGWDLASGGTGAYNEGNPTAGYYENGVAKMAYKRLFIRHRRPAKGKKK